MRKQDDEEDNEENIPQTPQETPPPVRPRPPSPPTSPPPSPPPERRSSPSGDRGPDRPLGDDYPPTTRPDLRVILDFIQMVKEATLESQFTAEELADFLNPQEHASTPPNNPNLLLSLRNFITLLGSSQAKYEEVRQNIKTTFPDIEMLSYYQAEKRAQSLSGIITWEHHMCVDSCLGFTGPFANMERCPNCGKHRYDQEELEGSHGERKVPRKVFTTFPPSPQLQAHWKNLEMAKKMFYRWEKTQELWQERKRSPNFPDVYDDILSGYSYLDAVDDESIGKYDTTLMLSMDGAQLYQNKRSDCWIYIWIILDLGPDERYKIRNILPGGIIPGPKPPWNIESFLFPGLAHLSVLQREGLPIWDAYH